MRAQDILVPDNSQRAQSSRSAELNQSALVYRQLTAWFLALGHSLRQLWHALCSIGRSRGRIRETELADS